MGPKVLDEIVGRQRWIVSRMARSTYLAFLCGLLLFQVGKVYYGDEILWLVYVYNIKSIFNGGVCLFVYIYLQTR